MTASRQDRGPATVTPSLQRGATLWSALYVIATLVIIGLVAIKSVPVYIAAYDVRSTMADVASDPTMTRASRRTIHRAIQRQFDAGYVDNVKGRDIEVNNDRSGRSLSVSYDVKRSLMFNLSLVYQFDETASFTTKDD